MTTYRGSITPEAGSIVTIEAGDISILDVAEQYTAEDVEAALAEIGARIFPSLAASNVSVADVAGNYTATEVEAVLAEIGTALFTTIPNTYVDVAGDTMTGNLTISGASPGIYLSETDTTDLNYYAILDGGTLQLQRRNDAGALLWTPFKIQSDGVLVNAGQTGSALTVSPVSNQNPYLQLQPATAGGYVYMTMNDEAGNLRGGIGFDDVLENLYLQYRDATNVVKNTILIDEDGVTMSKGPIRLNDATDLGGYSSAAIHLKQEDVTLAYYNGIYITDNSDGARTYIEREVPANGAGGGYTEFGHRDHLGVTKGRINFYDTSIRIESRTGNFLDFRTNSTQRWLMGVNGGFYSSGLSDPGAGIIAATGLNIPASTTESRGIEVGNGRSGDGDAYVDLIGDATYTGYGARFIRFGGANSASAFYHRGTGPLNLVALDAGRIQLYTTNTLRFTIAADGGMYAQGLSSQGVGTIYADTLFGDLIRVKGNTTENCAVEVGHGRTGNGASWVDLVGDPTYSDYGLRIVRNAGGANTNSVIYHRGTGDLAVYAQDLGRLTFGTNNTLRGYFGSTGGFVVGSPTGGDKGAGVGNFTNLFVNNNQSWHQGNVGAQINALTADATPDGATDYVVTYDASATTQKKVLLSNLASLAAGVPTHVNIANGAPQVSATVFQPQSSITESSWESVGPTGSGADNTWTALDGLPTDVDWIEVRIDTNATSSSGTANTNRSQDVYARDDGSTQAANANTRISRIGSRNDGSGNGIAYGTCTHKIPVTSRVFDMTWASNFDTSDAIFVYLVGYGYNA